MIHYGGVSAWLAYPLLLLPVIFVSVFPVLACVSISLVVKRFSPAAIFTAPIIWVTFDWLRGVVTGMDWNALGYSQAFQPFFIRSASWGGVWGVTILIVATNAAIAGSLVRRKLVIAIVTLIAVAGIVILSSGILTGKSMVHRRQDTATNVIAVQPNVPMGAVDADQMKQLLERHLALTARAFDQMRANSSSNLPQVVIWPESPMNFAYSRDPQLQKTIVNFAQKNHTSVLLNSLEPALSGGSYNSAVLVNEQGQKVAQYDKIRLMPFGEYVPLPRWLPGSGSVRGIVGEFTPGSSYTLMPLGALRAGVFICIEAAHPEIARSFTNEGADVLINISNDGYLGPTAVMRQHLANAVFRAVENDRDIIRVTNSGITAYISSSGAVSDTTPPFQEAVRTWTVSRSGGQSTFYSRHGDLFACGCALITLGVISATFMKRSQYPDKSG